MSETGWLLQMSPGVEKTIYCTTKKGMQGISKAWNFLLTLKS
jgi:hypothetical protein